MTASSHDYASTEPSLFLSKAYTSFKSTGNFKTWWVGF